VRLTGRNGLVRELNAVLDVSAEYCVLPPVDAYNLGYQEAFNNDPVVPAANTIDYLSYEGIAKAALVVIAGVELGGIRFRDVEFVAHDLPQQTRFDVLLGRSLLQFLRLNLDYPNGRVAIETSQKRVADD
jgi:predicted aspartyl protease